jgi:hypothetical protein
MDSRRRLPDTGFPLAVDLPQPTTAGLAGPSGWAELFWVEAGGRAAAFAARSAARDARLFSGSSGDAAVRGPRGARLTV